jgi:hypothetical protein
MRIKIFKASVLTMFVCALFLGVNAAVLAEGPILPGTAGVNYNSCGSCRSSQSDPACKQYCGNYELNDFVGILITVADWILRISGSLALLAFVFGGAMFLISAGSNERINKAKNIIVSAVIGLIIVLTSYMIIGFIFKATGVDPTGTAWSRVSWWQ